jgi:opacity protein-like surface antigen
MKKILATLAVLIAATASAAAADCVAKFKASAPDNGVPSMSLFNFGEHWELQFDTPSQQFPETVTLAIDGAPQQVFISGGLDDLLFVASSEEAALNLSEDFLAGFAAGSELTASGKLGGKAFTTTFALKGSAAAVKRLKGGCK